MVQGRLILDRLGSRTQLKIWPTIALAVSRGDNKIWPTIALAVSRGDKMTPPAKFAAVTAAAMFGHQRSG
jgi:hypothetical protein